MRSPGCEPCTHDLPDDAGGFLRRDDAGRPSAGGRVVRPRCHHAICGGAV